jgi:hypothetical protein
VTVDPLRTTIPISLVKQWNLTNDEYLDWTWEIHKGEQVVVIRKVKREKK